MATAIAVDVLHTDTASNSAVVQLKDGDRVYVRLNNSNLSKKQLADRLSTFSGYLVWEMWERQDFSFLLKTHSFLLNEILWIQTVGLFLNKEWIFWQSAWLNFFTECRINSSILSKAKTLIRYFTGHWHIWGYREKWRWNTKTYASATSRQSQPC